MKTPAELRVLVVDDNAHARKTAIGFLNQFGVGEVHEAIDGAEALIHLHKTAFDLILTDWYMPDVSGAGLVRVVRAPDWGPNGQAEIAVMTAYASRETIGQVRELGIETILVKPLEAKPLAACLGKLMAASSFGLPAEADGDDDAYFL